MAKFWKLGWAEERKGSQAERRGAERWKNRRGGTAEERNGGRAERQKNGTAEGRNGSTATYRIYLIDLRYTDNDVRVRVNGGRMGGRAEGQKGRMMEGRNGGRTQRRKGGKAEERNGGRAEWQYGYIPNLLDRFTVHRRRRRRHLLIIYSIDEGLIIRNLQILGAILICHSIISGCSSSLLVA
jgi:hypothetical protein